MQAFLLLADGEAPTVGQGLDQLLAFMKTPPGLVILALAGGLMALRIYYAARSAVSVRADPRLGPPRGFLASYFARIRLERLVREARYEEAADLLQAWQPQRAVEVAELYVRAKRFTRAAAILVANHRLRAAAETYVRAGSHDLAAELFERAEAYAEAEAMYVKAGNKLAAARMLARTGKPERAARYYSEAERPREAAEQLEKAGKTREAAEAYVETLSLIERAGTLENKAHPRERLMGTSRLRDQLCEKVLALYEKLGDFQSQVGFLVEHDRPADAAQLLVEHHMLAEATQVLTDANAGQDTKRRILQQQ
jgi:tetratricopeptide (TPR) repeat protein